MSESLLNYFTAEKNESLLFILIGIAAIAFSLYLWKTGNQYKGMAYPLVAIALIQIVVGGTVYFRTDDQVRILTEQMNSAPVDFRTEELAKMKKVNDSFKLYKAIEIVLLVIGIFMSYYFAESMTLYSVAIGLIAQSSLMLVADLFAERRAMQYVVRLQEFIPNTF